MNRLHAHRTNCHSLNRAGSVAVGEVAAAFPVAWWLYLSLAFLLRLRLFVVHPVALKRQKRSMSKRRRIILLLAVGYGLGLVWGQVRLPLSAVKSLSDYRLLREKRFISASDEDLQMLPVQRWYLKRCLNIVDNAPPRISVRVQWNCGVIARAHSGYYIAPEAAEYLDCLYFCLFGAWVPVHRFRHSIA